MTLTPTLQAAFLALSLSAGTAAGVYALQSIHSEMASTAARVQQLNDEQTLRAAHIAFTLDHGRTPQGEAELIATGYLLPAWAEREQVSTEPVQIPEGVLDAAAE